MSEPGQISWQEGAATQHARWRSENGSPPPGRVVVADDSLPAAQAYRLVCEGTALLWRGDYHNARQLLQALARRIDKKSERKTERSASTAASQPAGADRLRDAFNCHRQSQAQRARLLGMLLLPLDTDYTIPLRRAPDVAQACREAYGPANGLSVLSLRELQGLVGAHEWRKKGVAIAALDAPIHPYYGVFSPLRGEYVDLVAQAPLPVGATQLAFDIGTGSGVLAAVLARRGIARVIATDLDPRALACAADNLGRLGLAAQVDVIAADLFPAGRAALVVCNPPWLPARPSSAIEHAIYDPDSRMLRGFLNGLAEHLTPAGEGWLILSDFAEHLGLRSRDELLAMIAAAGLRVLGRLDIAPRHGKAGDRSDPLHAARAAEITSLWRLAAA